MPRIPREEPHQVSILSDLESRRWIAAPTRIGTGTGFSLMTPLSYKI